MKTGIEWNQILEDAIIGKLVGAIIDDGYRIEMSDQDGGGLFVYAWPADSKKPAAGQISKWVKLVPGNGCDVIVDYATTFEATIKPANDFAEQFRT